MNLSWRNILAIAVKELLDIRSNFNVLLIYVLPVFLTLLYQIVIPELPLGFGLAFGLLFLVAMVGIYVPSMMIAEEKEKKTLEVLMLSPASSGDIFVGKGLVTFASIFFTMVLLVVLANVKIASLSIILIGTALTSIFCIFIGMIIGMLVSTQLGTGAIGTPVYILFMLVPLLGDLSGGWMEIIAKALPTYYFLAMVNVAFIPGAALGDVAFHMTYLLASVIIAFFALLTIYRRTGPC